MRWLVVSVVLASACGKRDECSELQVKLRPVIEDLMDKAGKRMSDAELADMMAEVCKEPTSAPQKEFRACVLAADDKPAVAGCFQKQVEDYMKTGDDALRRLEQRKKDDLAKLEQLHAVDAGVAPTDAATPDAPLFGPPIDVATLPEIAVDSKRTSRDKVEVFAVDAPVGRVIVRFAGHRPLLTLATKDRFTGHVAGSAPAVFDALVATTKYDVRAPKLRGGGPTVDLSFGDVPLDDVVRLLGDVLRRNIVIVGHLPHADLNLYRTPARAVLAAVLALDDRRAIEEGNTIYIVPAKMKLPKPLKLPGSTKLDLTLHDGTLADAVAVIRAITPFPVDVACGGPTYTLRLHHVTTTQVARALAVISGTPLGGGPCTVPETTKPDAKDLQTVATAIAGGKAAAVIAHGASHELVRRGPGIEIVDSIVQVGPPTQPPRDDVIAADYLANLKRTSLVIRRGDRTQATLETRDGKTIAVTSTPMGGELAPGLPYALRDLSCDDKGVTFTFPAGPDPRPTSVLVPLAK